MFRPQSTLEEQISKSQVYYSQEGDILRIELAKDEQYRTYATLSEFSPLLIDTVLLYEDRWFYYHLGVNPITLIKGLYYSYIKQERKIGGSTISMQVARTLFDIESSNIIGKLQQILHAVYLEAYFSKHEILEAYLNLVPMGGNISGYATAAKLYFTKQVSKLSISEIITLVALPQNPNKRRPTQDNIPVELTNAKERIFAIITASRFPELQKDRERILAPLFLSYTKPFQAPHFVEYLLATNQTNTHTTLHLKTQKHFEYLTKQYVLQKQNYGIQNASALLLNYKTMEIEALVGSADYFNDDILGQVNGALAKRSPGSTLKPFIYALALDQGLIHEGSILIDAPTSFNEYTPDNFKHEYSGVIPARQALIYSRNIPAISLASKLTHPDLYDLLLDNEISLLQSRTHYGLSLVLGGAELNALELARMYAMLANHGILKPIKFTESSDNYFGTATNRKLLSTAAAFITLEMLYTNPPPHKERAIPHSVAYKTGTSINFKDGWAIGVFDSYVLVVWIGNFDGSGNPEFQGRYAAGPLLFTLIRGMRALQTPSPRNFNVPVQVSKIEICKASGMIPNQYCLITSKVWHIPGVSPITQSTLHQKIYLNQEGYRVEKNNPEAIVSEIVEVWPSHVMKIFEKSGIARKSIPPFAESGIPLSQQGLAPSIVSPNSGLSYILSFKNAGLTTLPLQAHAEHGVEKLHWFGDDIYLGTSKPDEVLEVPLQSNIKTIKVIDEKGRFDSTSVQIIISE